MYTLETITCGAASWGYCAIGSEGMLIAPASTITVARTPARIGRLMKTSTNMCGLVWTVAGSRARG
jgi:hypothetical protein